MTVGIKDVARVANVSPATVSRVLSGRAVDPAMHERVMAAVRSTGYRPNLAARRLRSRHTNTIGLIVADIRNPFFTAVSRVVEDIAYERGLRVILCNTDEDPAREAMYLQLMQEERVTGMILAPTRAGLDKVARMETDFPVVLIDRAGEGMVHDSVVLDNPAMAARLVEHLHERGCRHVAGLFGAASSTGRERRAGFENAAERLAMRTQVVAVPHGPGEAERCVAALMQAEDRPDALLASNGVMLMAVLRALAALGLKVPDDVAVVGFDREGWMDLVAGGLSVIEQPVEAIGRTAMTMLFDRLDDAAIPSRKVVLSGTLVARGSSLHRQEA
ncbi:transcriptional regulator, LacI family [Novosphingobium nitrogenifigens DSM 19370]|uniref:Transcriptional regulator, LacI family n=1 Tax=Novosphingobium nitrogenifigens DSM 19370 TaxID=983920 RepID=F1Z3J0_9SPHN|nr:LacI family DNA-binding transcriptional regulator [Novosphingobium nitrogenifigens]EGD60804.1 transcriptional regulator, LacI family [Novosphingobium nitrogenifigens DSM 19370]